MRVRKREEPESLLRQATSYVDDDRGDRYPGDRECPMKCSSEARRGVGQRRENEHGVPASGQAAGTGPRHRGGDDHVGIERQVRAVRLDRAYGKHGDGACAIEVAHFLPRQLRQLMYRHHHPWP